ncbi:MAG: hypothetical protein MASP_00671 [Candidatus Methanolliviera sp. GoM_asphalt]|nr:MAG: hypothetical protein MASP_00671 [Candidatus Methanolliviera sp. GoM_asphalt]
MNIIEQKIENGEIGRNNKGMGCRLIYPIYYLVIHCIYTFRKMPLSPLTVSNYPTFHPNLIRSLPFLLTSHYILSNFFHLLPQGLDGEGEKIKDWIIRQHKIAEKIYLIGHHTSFWDGNMLKNGKMEMERENT